MALSFTKMHGAGNDYIYLDGFHTDLTALDFSALAQRLSHRHTGIGSDGLVIIAPSQVADGKMIMYNADGSRGLMCGNAIRCVGKWLYDRSLCPAPDLSIETDSGIKSLHLHIENQEVKAVTVNMGTPSFSETLINAPFTVNGHTYHITCLSMGNPHCVIFTQPIDQLNLPQLGPLFEHHPLFPQGINTEFVEILSPTHLNMRVWERGSGETLACGTGACAAVMAGISQKHCLADTDVTVDLLGGSLTIRYDSLSQVVYMTGPATTVFEGSIHL